MRVRTQLRIRDTFFFIKHFGTFPCQLISQCPSSFRWFSFFVQRVQLTTSQRGHSSDASGRRLSMENINYADTTFVFLATKILVLLMTPALSLFYGGMVRKKISSAQRASYAAIAVISIWMDFSSVRCCFRWLRTVDRWWFFRPTQQR